MRCGRLQVCFPGIQEQHAILARVASESRRLDAVAERASSEIILLKEYRARLISDAVTGKLDVRQAAARLPADIADSESRDEEEAEPEAGDRGDEEAPEEAEA